MTRLTLALLSFVVLAACQKQTPLPEDPYPLGFLDRATLDGPALDLTALDGKVVVINFWSPS